MHRNSARPLRPRAAQGDIGSILAGISEPQTMRVFLSEVLTPAERADLELRWRLMQMLHRGVSQRAIARALGISLCKITRGSRVLKQAEGVSRRILDASSSASAGFSGRRRSSISYRQPPRRGVCP
jgi:TrpR family transcriptional regulator, trp operon repressor